MAYQELGYKGSVPVLLVHREERKLRRETNLPSLGKEEQKERRSKRGSCRVKLDGWESIGRKRDPTRRKREGSHVFLTAQDKTEERKKH